MRLTRGIAALIDVDDEPEDEVKLATLALHLGMNVKINIQSPF